MGCGAESGGNLRVDHDGKSGVCRDGPAPLMMGSLSRSWARASVGVVVVVRAVLRPIARVEAGMRGCRRAMAVC